MRVKPEDILELAVVSDPQIAPQGRRVAYAVRRAAPDLRRYVSHIFVDGRAATQDDAEDTQPRWSPDGTTLAFVRTRDRAGQIHLLRPDGRIERLTDLPPGRIAGLAWSPDGRRLAFTFRPHPPKDEDVVARHVTRLRYREEGTGWLEPHAHVYVWDGTLRRITDGDFDHGPPAWSPDGRRLAFAAARSVEDDYRAMHQDIWIAPAEGGDIRRVAKPDGPVLGLAWSPDGTKIAFVGHDDPEAPWGARNPHVWIADPASGAARDLMPGVDRPCEDVTITDTRPFLGTGQPPVWARDGRILFLLSDRGTTHLWALAPGGPPWPLTSGRMVVKQFSVAVDGTIALLGATMRDIGDVYVLRGEDLARQTSVNETYFASRMLPEPLRFPVEADDGEVLDAWMLLPPGHDGRAKVPAVLQIHGGPRAQYGDVWFHEFHMIAAMGIAVVWSNPRGSQGYGERFASCIAGAWGDRDFRDLMAVADEAVRRFPIDAGRFGVMGGSYGGYMTNWIIGHTDRFRCAITMRCVSNLLSMAGTSDFGYEDRREFGVHPWEDFDRLWRMSPLAYAARMRTPLLILHSEGDLRCPIEQAEQLFAYLKGQRREVEFVRFPEETHDLSRGGRPDRRVERLRHIARWLDRHLLG